MKEKIKMAAKGTEAKKEIFQKLQEVFPGSFFEDEGKVLRIPMSEAGVRIEIKCQLTAAKNNLGGDDVPGAFGNAASVPKTQPSGFNESNMPAPAETESLEMTQEEKNNVVRMMAALGL